MNHPRAPVGGPGWPTPSAGPCPRPLVLLLAMVLWIRRGAAAAAGCHAALHAFGWGYPAAAALAVAGLGVPGPRPLPHEGADGHMHLTVQFDAGRNGTPQMPMWWGVPSCISRVPVCRPTLFFGTFSVKGTFPNKFPWWVVAIPPFHAPSLPMHPWIYVLELGRLFFWLRLRLNKMNAFQSEAARLIDW